jgi:hypothetical protein
MWLNTVAHGDLAQVDQLSGQRAPGLAAGAGWRNARAEVARALAEYCAGDERVLRHLQTVALVPLELSLVSCPDLSPARLLEVTLAELRLAEA